MLINDFVQNSSDVFSSVKSTITARIGLWVNPRVDYVTSRSDFNLADLRRKRMTIYLGSNPGDLQRLAPLYNLLMQQLVDLNTRTLPEHGGGDIQILIVLDEFKRIGKADVIAAAFSYVAGYGIRLMPVVQSRFQLNEIYGPNVAKEITANCGAEIIYAPKDKDDADYISARLGYQTVKSQSQSRQRASLAANNNSAGSTSTSDQKRALLLPQELAAMPKRLGLIFRAGMPPVLHHKIRYYKDRAMMARVLPPPVVPIYTLPPEYGLHRSAPGGGSEDMMVLADAAVLAETKPLPEFQIPKDMIADVARISAQITANGGKLTPAAKRSLGDSVQAWCVD